MFDVFYLGNKKPNLFPFEYPVSDINQAAKLSRTKFFWLIHSDNDYSDFDFDWIPVPWEEHQIHIWPSQWHKNGGTFFVNTQLINQSIRNYKSLIVKRQSSYNNWEIPKNINITNFDFSWHNDLDDPPYIYQFGTQWQRTGGPRYVVPGATDVKYVDVQRSEATAIEKNWEIPENIDTTSFDFSWHPDERDPKYVYQFGTQWYPIGGPRYVVPGATDVKYVDVIKATVKKDKTKWIYDNEFIDEKTFDFSWTPHPYDPPYIYQFGTQWQRTGGPRYVVPGATDVKYVTDLKSRRLPNKKYWVLDKEVNYNNFDFSWHPDDSQKKFKHIIGTQWQRSSETYYYEGDTTVESPPINFVNDIRITYPTNRLPRYYIEDSIEALIMLHPEERFWALSKDMKYDKFDFSWHPDISQVRYQHVFGSNWQKHGNTYLINAPSWLAGNTQLNYVNDQKTESNANLDIFFVDKYNNDAQIKFDRLKQKYPKLQKTRYMNSLLQTALRCASKTNNSKFWLVSSECHYEEFDFSWHPEPWQHHMTHVFGSQWQKWSDTLLISKWELERNSKWCKDIKDFPNLNFVNDQQVVLPITDSEIWYIDHYNTESKNQLELLKLKYKNVESIRFVDNYLDTFKRILDKTTSNNIWIISSVCDYHNFDFSWKPEVWQEDMIHIFASGSQALGDTFYFKTSIVRAQLDKVLKLDDLCTINYTNQQKINRFDVETVCYETDTVVDAVLGHKFKSRYAYFKPADSKEIEDYIPCLWSGVDRAVHLLNDSGSHAFIPIDAQSKIKTQIYDFPYIKRVLDKCAYDPPLDVIFLSNGEPAAEEMWNRLHSQVKGKANRIKRIDGVNGRATAYKACAEASETPWFFNVFAKLEVDENFNWNWQPDRLQETKSYVFHAKNPLNGLEYGHMAMICYNKNLVLNTENPGIDFTLSKPNEIVPILSGVAHFNQDEWTTWRTSFREVLKLKHFMHIKPSAETKYRLDIWSSRAEGLYAEWCLKGAADAINYYNQVNGIYDKLLYSFEWNWLREFFNNKYY